MNKVTVTVKNKSEAHQGFSGDGYMVTSEFLYKLEMPIRLFNLLMNNRQRIVDVKLLAAGKIKYTLQF